MSTAPSVPSAEMSATMPPATVAAASVPATASVTTAAPARHRRNRSAHQNCRHKRRSQRQNSPAHDPSPLLLVKYSDKTRNMRCLEKF
jgi:hypothetical protein